ncbi:hypothetical protein SADUNF_Sadunf10G0033300 [Salix dunnii]|uniref:START domain-containing protein n=1 Tax=Salix dunnii TaxID=1413687 RepID=A0A835JUW0_9ROSI|nr:hypothetical protein SADUNF_Sadunf10G0033300 [Salix dunnii]
MDETFFDLMEFFKKPSIIETFVDILLCAVPIWLAVMIGLVIGWSWRPRWTGLVFLGLRSKSRFLWTAPPGFGARRLWLAFTALSALSVCRTIWSNFKGKDGKSVLAAPASSSGERRDGSIRLSFEMKLTGVYLETLLVGCYKILESSAGELEDREDIVTEKDLEHLLHLLEGKDGRKEWQCMMERSTSNMRYQAWRREPQQIAMLDNDSESDTLAPGGDFFYQEGPTVYRSRTVFEDATPELVRDFFWDDEFRPKWDPMLTYFKILEECPHTGRMIVHWIKKFPFFCSDREYIIGRRIWDARKAYYCVTKGVPYPGLHKSDKPRRVDLYFSSWVIRAVESRRGDGQMSACEVTLLHYEDMGIPKDVAKLGVRHGMWGAVKKLHSGMRAYQNARKSEASLSRSALMARITTNISFDEGMDSSEPVVDEEDKSQAVDIQRHDDHGIDWKWIAIGGTVTMVCFLHSGAIGKALLLGAGQRIARRNLKNQLTGEVRIETVAIRFRSLWQASLDATKKVMITTYRIFMFIALTWNVEDLMPPTERLIFNFNSREELKKWHLYSDSEYGGSSSASLEIMDEGNGLKGVFSGNLSLDVAEGSRWNISRSGFCGMRSKKFDGFIDLDAYDTIALKLKGDGRSYISTIYTENWVNSPGQMEDNSWQAFVFVPKDNWYIAKIPLARYLPTWRGNVIDASMEMNQSRILGMSLSVNAGGGIPGARSGPGDFKVELDWIKAFRTQ